MFRMRLKLKANNIRCLDPEMFLRKRSFTYENQHVWRNESGCIRSA
jgi:hypothetical protein